jgi:hypothetical protein
MENEDIRKSISLKIDKEVTELTNICSVDKLAQKICSNADFWEPIFEEHNLPFINKKYNNVQVWISTFEKEKKLKLYTDRLIEILEYPKVEDFKYMDLDDDLIGIGLYVNIDQCPWLEVFNIPEVDYNQLLLIVNSYIINKFSKKEIELTPNASITIIDDNYLLTIISDTKINNIDYIDISIESVRTIFYRILSYGVIPFDTFNGYTVKMII